MAVAVGSLVAVMVLGWAAATDLQAHARNRSEHTALADARRTLAGARTDLATTTSEEVLATGERDSLRTSITSSLGQLASAEKTLDGTNAYAFLQGLDIGTLHTCLGGVKSAFQQIAAHDNDRAAADVSAVSAACQTLDGGTNDGLVYPFDFPDPAVLLVGSTFFGYATNSVAGNIQIIESSDRVHWSAVGNALPGLPSWAAPDATWAPAVAQIGGKFVLYYAAVVAGGGEECVSVATATQPQGPFTDSSSAPLECQPSLGGSLDSFPFIGPDGAVTLVWKSNGGAGPATIWSQPLQPSGTAVVAGTTPTPLLTPTQSWESGVVEAPDLIVSGGRYLLFYSGNNWNTANYGVGVATCAGPAGPCTKPLAGPILASGRGIDGPGGESVFTDASGSTWIAFHAWIPGSVGYPNSRDLYIRRLDLAGTAPSVGGTG